MNIDKIEKRLPDEILILINQEATSHDISRQEAISRLISSVRDSDLAEENRQLRTEIDVLKKLQDDEKKEIKFLREEISKFSSGLTTLAVTIGKGKGAEDHQMAVDSLSVKIKELGEEIAVIRPLTERNKGMVIEENLPLISSVSCQDCCLST
jgi:hypothetical protein